ncbi:trimeric intracellular cation channel family protein [Nostoc sp. CHAB 5715]|uniref:trimeric intracellular cation channel family protein n=1 Tax=Nostoc sp. CHAB 5715 TaxID=2780400 RepID=UPI001E3E2D7A|nr:trimeric intracellular cation channel family protein [Nostoc sp. CHAB 5715]MCC5621923.1 trimeric intracellular cation channel family protein [Nostoc sp. CHAB 5715]
MELIYWMDILGVLVFAISGTMIGIERQLDIFGASVIAFATAVGGGTLRDVLIGSTPVGWMKDPAYIYVIILGIFLALLFKKEFSMLSKTIFLFDTIGLGLYSIIGLKKALLFGMSPMVAVIMGTVSAVFGGVLRDILTNRVPLIFRKEIYAILCIIGGIVFLILNKFFDHDIINTYLTMGLVIFMRILVVVKKWSLPKIS